MRGTNDGTGIGLAEVYDLNQATPSKLANISTRGFVDTGENVMIGGFIVRPGGGTETSVILRAIGPSLGAAVENALADPTLELHDSSGALVAANDNWKDSQQAEIQATGLAPTDDAESALVALLAPGCLHGDCARQRGHHRSGVGRALFAQLKTAWIGFRVPMTTSSPC